MPVLHGDARRRREEQRPRHAGRRSLDAARRGARGLILALLVVGCGADGPAVRHTPEPAHAAEVERDPYKLTCGDLRTQSRSEMSQHLVIRAEFKLADERVLRRRVREMTENRVGRSIYWAMTEICEGREAAYEPGRAAVEAVRRGRYLVQPRPESWNRPEP